MASYYRSMKSMKSMMFHHSDHYLHLHQEIPSGDNYLFALELEESDVVWGQNDSHHSEVPSSSSSPRVGVGMIPPAIKKKKKKKRLEKPAVSSSLPVNVPHWSMVRQLHQECDGDEEVDAATSMTEKLPPREFLARRRGEPFSVQEGLGRTLKGMELCRVRNQILKKIVGFED